MTEGSDEARSGRGPATGTDGGTSPPTCPHCERTMYARHCKYVCPSHGVVIDCSDPFR